MSQSARRFGAAASGLAPILVLAMIWLPLLTHYTAPTQRVSDEAVAAARVAPANAQLLELREFDVLPTEDRDPAIDVEVANGILAGRLAVPGLPEADIGLPFSPEDLEGLPGSLWLWFAGYVAPEFLVAAFEETDRHEYLDLARDMILAWNRYESRQRLPNGYIWNDHAIVARAGVLAEFWRVYRPRSGFDQEVGRAVLEQAARYRTLLADPGRFTFSTNHGLMQNLGLLQLQLAFPTLPDDSSFRRVALDRLEQQLDYLLGPDGVFRENSAGYQAFDLRVLGWTLRAMTLAGVAISPELQARYERGVTFLDQLERPDGTLPASGDTDAAPHAWLPRIARVERGATQRLEPRVRARPEATTIASAAGYAIRWEGLKDWPDPLAMSQTVVTWTRPPAPSHEHADEPAVFIWSRGISWLTGVGYWPFADDHRPQAESWGSSNAPHLVGEPAGSQRLARLRSTGSEPGASLIDVERSGPGSYAVRRQVVHLPPDLWLVFDDIQSDAGAATETTWTLSPDVAAQPGDGPSSFRLSARDASATLVIAGSDGMTIREDRGSLTPFAGWQVRDSVPEPAPAITTMLPAGNAWQVVILSTASPDSPRFYSGGAPRMKAGSTGDAWTIEIPLATGPLVIARAGSIVDVADAAQSTTRVRLQDAPDPTQELTAMRAAFEQTANTYPVFHDLLNRRAFASGAVILLMLGQTGLWLVGRRRAPHLTTQVGILAAALWVVLASWIIVVLLPTWQVLALQ